MQCSLLHEKIVFQSFYGALLTFRYFLLQGKVLCFACVSRLLVRCLLLKHSKDLVKKLYLQLNLTQMVHSNSKMLLLNQLIVYQSFYGALLAFSYFLLQGKFCFVQVSRLRHFQGIPVVSPTSQFANDQFTNI